MPRNSWVYRGDQIVRGILARKCADMQRIFHSEVSRARVTKFGSIRCYLGGEISRTSETFERLPKIFAKSKQWKNNFASC